MLIILINKATKLFSYFLTLDKEYIADIKLGVITDTWDISGKVLITGDVKDIDTRTVLAALNKFKGKIEQVPPAYSSVKYKGKPSYNFARKGQKIDLKPKTVNIHGLELISLKDDLLTLRINCSSGTYIRSLAYEIGNLLGFGASLKGLRRVGIGNYKLGDSMGIREFLKQEFEKEYLESVPYMISIIRLLDKNQDIYIEDKYRSNVINGWPITGEMMETYRAGDLGLLKKGSFVKIKDRNKNLLAVHEILSKRIFSDRKDKNLKLTKSIIIF